MILAAMDACYGDLTDPDFSQVYENLGSSLHRHLVGELRAAGLTIVETTDPNYDIATHVIAHRGSSKVALALSGVGPFATVRQFDDDGHSCWMSNSHMSSSSLAVEIAKTVQQRGSVF